MDRVIAKCSCCGKEELNELSKKQYITLQRYRFYGRKIGFIQDLFQNVPPWIRSGAIDLYSGGLEKIRELY